MTLKTSAYIAAALVAMAGAAHAFEVESADVTLGYGNVASGSGADGTFAKASASLNFNAFDADVSAAYGGIGNNETATVLSFAPSLEISETTTIGAFVDYTDRSIANANSTHVGITGDYNANGVIFSGYAGLGLYDLALDDSTVYGTSVTFDIYGNLDTGFFYDAEDSDVLEFDSYGFRAGYELDLFATPTYASASVSRVSVNGNDATVVGLGLSIPLGTQVQKGEKRFNDHSAIQNSAYLE